MVVRRSCLKKEELESGMKKAKIERRPVSVSFSTTDHTCAICRSPLDVCGVCSKPRQTTTVEGRRKDMRKGGNACGCKCKCHSHDTTQNVAPVDRTEQEAVEVQRDMFEHNLQLYTNRRFAEAQRATLDDLLTRRAQILEFRKQNANLQKLKDVLEWGQSFWEEEPDWVDSIAPYETAEEVLKVFGFHDDDLRVLSNAYELDRWTPRCEKLLTDEIETVEAQGPCPSMQCEVDLVYFALAKERLSLILHGDLTLQGMLLGEDQACVRCDAIFPGQEISNILQLELLLAGLDNRSPTEKLELGGLVRQEFGDKGEIDIVRLIQLFDRISGAAVDDGEFRSTTEEEKNKDEDEVFLYDVCYVKKMVFDTARGNTQRNKRENRAELNKSLDDGVLLPRAGGGFTLPVAGSSAGM